MITEELSLPLTDEQIAIEQANFISKVYAWMAASLVVTGLVAIFTFSVPQLAELIYHNNIIYYGLLLCELAVLVYLSFVIDDISAQEATALLLIFAAFNGLTLSVIFLIYTSGSIATTFFVTAGTFAVMSAYGYYTKRDLTTVGNIAFMGLLGVIIASAVNFFLQNETLHWIMTYVGVLIFTALIAYDTQKIKETNILGNSGTAEDRKEAIMGALELYLNFINLFLRLLDIFGKRKDD
ncbi:Bax inhibitor-1/YccA family protein [Rufibacter roseus]|uniref:Bax inhibitor-1/YccA family protein n=1 Tax=Rufibacter roseus TaxID=1567108 RepID=A0ABW2DHX1_9BACT|nr:Bax inhibitor-1/YccA family protein [Rufibacter roseus]